MMIIDSGLRFQATL